MSLFRPSQLGNFDSPRKKTMNYVLDNNSQVADDDFISQEYRANEMLPGQSMKASTFLNLTMLNDRECQSEYGAIQ